MAIRSATRFSRIMSTRFSPSAYWEAARVVMPSGFMLGLPPSWLMRSASQSRCCSSSLACWANSSFTDSLAMPLAAMAWYL